VFFVFLLLLSFSFCVLGGWSCQECLEQKDAEKQAKRIEQTPQTSSKVVDVEKTDKVASVDAKLKSSVETKVESSAPRVVDVFAAATNGDTAAVLQAIDGLYSVCKCVCCQEVFFFSSRYFCRWT
jgi:hypothetical protein